MMINENRNCRLLFVYGTLRSETGHAMAKYLAERATLIGMGKLDGRLYDFGAFPGMVEAIADTDQVVGEIWELHDTDATLPELDRYEGCVTHEPQPWVFVRRLNEVVMDNRQRVTAWVYWYGGDVADGKWMESGNYLEK